jgi:hypothetical protein
MLNQAYCQLQAEIEPDREAWTIQIADQTLSLAIDDHKLARRARLMYGSFAAECERVMEPMLEIEMRVDPAMADQRPRSIVTGYDGRVFTIDSYNFTGWLDIPGNRGAFSISPEPEAIDAVLRVCVAILLATRGGLLMHASSVAVDGGAFVFAALSEGGKSTIARLLRDDDVIGDELVALKWVSGSAVVCGTPFWNAGPTGSPRPLKVPVRAICLLEKDRSAAARPLESVTAAARMLPHIFYDPENGETNRRTLDALAGIAAAVPCYRLRFGLDVQDLRRCLGGIGQ